MTSCQTSDPGTKNIRVAVLIQTRDQPDLADNVFLQVSRMAPHIDKTVRVIECGSKKPEGCSKAMTHWFRDRNYRGRYYGFHRGLEFIRKEEGSLEAYDYVWFVVNDISFPDDEDALANLVHTMEKEPQMAILGPAEPETRDYEGCHAKGERAWHKVATVHGLAWLMRRSAIDEIGYCNPEFRYSWGASTELAYKLYKAGWFLAYADQVSLSHMGGSTYGTVVPVSRHEYMRRARAFAAKYFVDTYGNDWDNLFEAALPEDVETSMFKSNRLLWETPLGRERRFPWFWKAGSWVKQNILRMRPRES